MALLAPSAVFQQPQELGEPKSCKKDGLFGSKCCISAIEEAGRAKIV